MHHLGGFFAKPRPFLPGDYRHHRRRHRPRPHGARPWRGRFPALQGARHRSGVRGRPTTASYRDDWLWLGGQGSVINTKFNAPDGPICIGPARGRRPARRQRGLHAQLSAQLALQGQGHLPLHAAMVHPDGPAADRPDPGGSRRCATTALQRDRRHALGAREIEEPDPRDGRGPARLGDQPPARLGRADRALRQPQDRRLSARTPAVNARIIRAFHEGGADAWFAADHQALLGNGYSARRLRAASPTFSTSGSIRGSTHAYVIEARYGEGVRADLYRRRLGPASRLVPVVAARKLRHPRPGALRRRC